jgi:hypothetical protein
MSRINKLIFAGILLLGMQAAMVRAENTVSPKPDFGMPSCPFRLLLVAATAEVWPDELPAVVAARSRELFPLPSGRWWPQAG